MKTTSPDRGHRFTAAVINHAVRPREIEEPLFERGVVVSWATIRRRRDGFGAAFACRLKAARRKPGGTWHLDEQAAARFEA